MTEIRRPVGPTSDFDFPNLVFPVVHNGEPVGTGFSILDGGLVVTAAHVLRGRESICVHNRGLGKVFEVDFRLEHHEADIAVLGVRDQEMRNRNPFMLMPFADDKPATSYTDHLKQMVVMGDDLETYGYFTHSDRAPTVGRLLKGSVQRVFTEEAGIYKYRAFECSFENALHRLSGAPVMLEGDWYFGLVKGMVTKRESLDGDNDDPVRNLWATCLMFTIEIRRWIYDAWRRWEDSLRS